MSILTELQKEFPDCWFKEGNKFNGGNAVVWSGEGSMIGINSAFALDSYSFDPSESFYTMGILNELNEFVNQRGYYWEHYDSGTVLLYKAQ